MPYRSKKHVVIHTWVMQANGIELVRQGEYDMIMPYGQGALHQVIDPECLFDCLTFRTVSVATTVVTVANSGATIAQFFVTAQESRAAGSYFAKHF